MCTLTNVARHYWAALEKYIARDRKEHGPDLWEEFEHLVDKVRAVYRLKQKQDPPTLDSEDIKEFLADEVGNAPDRAP